MNTTKINIEAEHTWINSEASSTSLNIYDDGEQGNRTQENPSVIGDIRLAGKSIELEAGTVLPGGYVVKKRIGLPLESGEADVFLCEKGGTQFATKVYRNRLKINSALVEKLKNLSSIYIARLHWMGEIYGRSFEVYDYFENGSLAEELQKRTFTMEEIEVFVRNLNNALNELHHAGILHRDIKPSNIMRSNSNKDLFVLIDFGLSSVTRESLSVVVSQIGFTATYAAPEVLRGVYFDESDYYSLGIILYEMFTGKTPFGDDNTYTSTIFKPDNMPHRLFQLIQGLTYIDISHRNDKTNPNRRWTFEEVERWLKKEPLPVPGMTLNLGTEQKRSIPPISFNGKAYQDIDALCFAMAVDWEKGKQLIFREQLTRHLKNRRNVTDEQLYWASIIEDITNDTYMDNDLKMIKILYSLSPEAKYIFCPLGVYKTVEEFGHALLFRLNRGISSITNYVEISAEIMIKSGALLSVSERSGCPRTIIETIKEFGNRILQENWSHQKESYIYELAYKISGENTFNPGLSDGTVFTSIEDLKNYLATTGSRNFKELQRVCSYLLDSEYQMKPAMYGWLKSKGYDVSDFNI